MNRTFPLTCCLLLCLGSFLVAAERPPLGMNLTGVVDWSTELVFVDICKASRPWISQARGKPWGQGGPLDLLSDGNVKSLRDEQFAETILFTDFATRFPGGEYICLYDGEGEIEFGFDARATERESGRIVVEIGSQTGQASLKLKRTNPENPVKNIRLVPLAAEKTYRDQPFRKDFLARWKGFKVFRFMDWGRTNDSPVVHWDDRTTPESVSQALKSGVAPEYMLDLCNETSVEPWLCVPHLADDDYVHKLAGLTKARLKAGLKVYIEYSNECWNGQFGQARYCQAQGKALGLSKNEYEAQLRFYSQRSVEIFKIWEEVLGKSRVVRVLAAQSANPWTGTTVLDWKDAAQSADAIAIAPYFGHRFGDPKRSNENSRLTADAVVKMLAEDVAGNRKILETYAGEAKKRNLKLMAYESGQHLAGHGGAENDDRLTKLFNAVNRHPGMRELYQQDLKNWREVGGDLNCIFSSMGRYTKWGSWGVFEHARQDLTSAPKWQALQDYLAGP